MSEILNFLFDNLLRVFGHLPEKLRHFVFPKRFLCFMVRARIRVRIRIGFRARVQVRIGGNMFK